MVLGSDASDMAVDCGDGSRPRGPCVASSTGLDSTEPVAAVGEDDPQGRQEEEVLDGVDSTCEGDEEVAVGGWCCVASLPAPISSCIISQNFCTSRSSASAVFLV